MHINLLFLITTIFIINFFQAPPIQGSAHHQAPPTQGTAHRHAPPTIQRRLPGRPSKSSIAAAKAASPPEEGELLEEDGTSPPDEKRLRIAPRSIEDE